MKRDYEIVPMAKSSAVVETLTTNCYGHTTSRFSIDRGVLRDLTVEQLKSSRAFNWTGMRLLRFIGKLNGRRFSAGIHEGILSIESPSKIADAVREAVEIRMYSARLETLEEEIPRRRVRLYGRSA